MSAPEDHEQQGVRGSSPCGRARLRRSRFENGANAQRELFEREERVEGELQVRAEDRLEAWARAKSMNVCSNPPADNATDHDDDESHEGVFERLPPRAHAAPSCHAVGDGSEQQHSPGNGHYRCSGR